MTAHSRHDSHRRIMRLLSLAFSLLTGVAFAQEDKPIEEVCRIW